MPYFYISYSVSFRAFTVCVYTEVISHVNMELVSNMSETGLVIRGWSDKCQTWMLFLYHLVCFWMSHGTSASDGRDEHSLQNAKHRLHIDMADHQIKLHCISVTHFYNVELHKTDAVLLKVHFISEHQVVWWGIRSNSGMVFSRRSC
jgi:hypothetical protein